MVTTTLKTWKTDSTLFTCIRFLFEHLDLLEHTATMSAGKPVSILRVKAEKKSHPSFLLGSLQLYFL